MLCLSLRACGPSRGEIIYGDYSDDAVWNGYVCGLRISNVNDGHADLGFSEGVAG